MLALPLTAAWLRAWGMAKPVDISAEEIEASATVLDMDCSCAAEHLVIADDFPANPPVTASEIDVVERFFGDILDAVLRDAPPLPTGSSYKRLSG